MQSTTGNVGVHGHAGFRGEIIVKNNFFNGSGLTIHPEDVEVHHNKFINGSVNLIGKNINFSTASLVDTSLSIGSGEGQKITNISIKHNGILPGILYVGDKKVELDNILIKAKTTGKGLIFGNGNNENIYSRVTVEDIDRKGTVLPLGKYTQCFFEAGKISIKQGGNMFL
ncbi:hypothetical protein [Bacillus sp. T3]|uniref:hypothetical protein n=1 Tax=Bacillus sp. T3 TaxID=467262 RepID=UPI0029829709|nr:hypothetical protein [Bacillus sp. T3]